VIKQTLKAEIPEGFQRSEFLLDHGFLDLIVSRPEMRKTLILLLDYLAPKKRRARKRPR
jgi:acetyl-CoA carboxylase carboxyl transferase subunit beta